MCKFQINFLGRRKIPIYQKVAIIYASKKQSTNKANFFSKMMNEISKETGDCVFHRNPHMDLNSTHYKFMITVLKTGTQDLN